jgi:hypothetical protein
MRIGFADLISLASNREINSSMDGSFGDFPGGGGGGTSLCSSIVFLGFGGSGGLGI